MVACNFLQISFHVKRFSHLGKKKFTCSEVKRWWTSRSWDFESSEASMWFHSPSGASGSWKSQKRGVVFNKWFAWPGGGGEKGKVLSEGLVWKEVILLFNSWHFSILYLFSGTVALFRKSLRDLENMWCIWSCITMIMAQKQAET